jgi:FAD/FMN-containing dehydrogenase
MERYARDLTRFARESHASSATMLDDTARPSLWGRLRETLSMLLDSSPATTIFKISVPPSQLAALFTTLQQFADHAGLPHALVARAGGTLYFALLPASANDETSTHLTQIAAQIFQSVSAVGGESSLLFAPLTLKTRDNSSISSRSDLPLMRRIKCAFDPQNIFAPSRF